MAKRPLSSSSNDTLDAPALKAARTDDAAIEPVVLQVICDVFPPLWVQMGEWDLLMAWKDVSVRARASVMEALRGMLQPRYEALVNALQAWAKLPLETRFEFPSPRGPMPVTWVKGGNRDAVRPKNADPDETLMPRPLWVWAMTHSLFAKTPFPKANVEAAVAQCKAEHPRSIDTEPAWRIMSDFERYKESHPAHVARWSLAHHYPIPALISTFTCWGYGGSFNMGAPGNHQHFLRALLKQAWPTHEDLPRAIAFLLLWTQHTLFHTWVVDETFRQSAIDHLVVDFIFEWRRVVPVETDATYDILESLLDNEDFAFFRYWFASDPSEFNFDEPKTTVSATRAFKNDIKAGLNWLAKIALPVVAQ
jgi:hypothetical protein